MTLAKQPIVFIASSSKALDIAEMVNSILRESSSEIAVRLWNNAFDYSATFIESLENVTQEVDFAVLIAAADDVTGSFWEMKPSPRDNVVFELGLFMGYLGRARCFILKDKSFDLKLPTDLLGIHLATFNRSDDRELRYSLKQVGEQIRKLGVKHKVSRNTLDGQEVIRSFCESVEGVWWEKVTVEDLCALSFVRIEINDFPNLVTLAGNSFDKEGTCTAKWKSLMAHIDQNKSKLQYHWEGWHTSPGSANLSFHGYGEIEFDKPLKPGDLVNRGSGKFWDIDEASKKTKVKTIQLHRIPENSKVISTITNGKEMAVKSLIKKTLLEW